MLIKWDTSKRDSDLIQAIAIRANALAKSFGASYSVQEAMMDVTAVHANGCPLRLAEMQKADDANFGHDVFGIRRHINRRTGRLEDCFVPRFAAPEVAQCRI